MHDVLANTRAPNPSIFMKQSLIHYYDHVTLLPLNEHGIATDSQFTIQIVRGHEADAAAGRISEHAPLARAVFQRSTGEIVAYTVQSRPLRMRILSVEKHLVSA